MRKRIDLNFDWKYSESFAPEMTAVKYDDSGFENICIPHTNKELPFSYFDEKMYQFVSCYRKSFKKPAGAKGKHIFITFEGAANYAKVYLNGEFIGEHKGGYTPFSFDITDRLSANNVIAVELDSTERSEIPPFGNMVDYLCYGGIYREVHLDIYDEVYIKDVFVKTPCCLCVEKVVEADITFSEEVKGEMLVETLDGDKVLRADKTTVDGTVIRVRQKIGDADLWDISNPKLYTLRVTYGKDVVTKRFGFRDAKFTKNGFVLNGRKIKLIGLNRHQAYPYVGYAMPASAQKADADFLKYTLGCNVVRTSHYPDSVHFLERCDEIGLLVFTEMPSWQYLGEGEWRDNCLANIEGMVMRDRSHPSIILWGVRVNEGGDCDEFYTQTNALCRRLDPTRQTGGVRNFPQSHLLEDVYTFNDFSHSGGLIKLLPAAVVCGFKAPLLVTEHNGHMYPTKTFDREEIRREHALRHLRVQNTSFGSSRHSGAIGWCMSDYNTHKDFGSGDKICYHGVSDMFRVPKFAAAVYASQQDDFPVMETSSEMNVGEYPGAIVGQTYILTNCDYVEIYKNGVYKSTEVPARKEFPNLPHPPVLPKDFIGRALVEEEGLDEKTAAALKDALVAAGVKGYILPPHHYAEVVYAFFHGKMSFTQIYNIITKYFANWGNEQIAYRFDGYKDGKLVKSITRTAVSSTQLEVKADASVLTEDSTYDVTRIQLRLLDQNGNQLPFANNAVTVETNGVVDVIGPKQFSLIGGDRAFWVRTNGSVGEAEITITGENVGKQTITLTVESKRG